MKRLKTTTNRREYHILRCIDQDRIQKYMENITNVIPDEKGGKVKLIWKWQRRMYRTWKHTRKTQWKTF